MVCNRLLRVFSGVALVCIAAGAFADEPTLRIGVYPDFSAGNMRVTKVVSGGPATKMLDEQKEEWSIEANDIIKSIDGVTITSMADLISTLNKSLDGELSVSVIDSRTGEAKDWIIHAQPTATTPFGIAKDTYLRADRNDSETENRAKLVVVDNNRAYNTVVWHFPYVNPQTGKSESDLEYQQLLSELTRGLAVLKNYVISEPDPVWLNRELLKKLDEIVESEYARLLDPNIPAPKRKEIAERTCLRVNTTLEKSFKEWTAKNGYKISSAMGAAPKLYFNPKASLPNAMVEVLSKADTILTLLQNGQTLDSGANLLDRTPLWRRLPSTKASAYGTYYYRFVTTNPDGSLQVSPFQPLKKIDIKTVPDSSEVFFE